MNSQMVRLHKIILSRKLEKIGITYCQIGFIMQAVRHPGRSQEELSNVLSLDKGTAARTIAKLEKNGFLQRRENPSNKRQKLVYPAAKAIAIQEELHHILQESNETMLTDLNAEEKELLFDFMTRIIDSGRKKLDWPRVWDIL